MWVCCCIMCCFSQKWVKITMVISTLLILACAILSIIFGVIAQDNVIYGIIGAILEEDIQYIILVGWVILGVLLIFMLWWTAWVAWKRFCLIHYIYAFLLTLSILVFTILGLSIMVISTSAADELEELCESRR